MLVAFVAVAGAAESPAAATVLDVLVEAWPVVVAADPLLVVSLLAEGLLVTVEVVVTGAEVLVAFVAGAAVSTAAATVLALLVESVPAVDAAEPLLADSLPVEGLLVDVAVELDSGLLTVVEDASTGVPLEAAGADNGAAEVPVPVD